MEEEKTSGKKILFFGRGYKDYLIYMVFILNNMGYSVLVNDKSTDKDLADVISYNDFNTKIRTYRNVDFNFSEDYLEGYDYVLYYYTDYPADTERWQYAVFNVSVFKSELYLCQQIINAVKTDVIVILRDQVRNSVDKKYISKYILNPAKIIGLHEIKLDEYDKEYQFRMDYDGVGLFKYLSEPYVRALVKTVCTVTGRGQGCVRKALKFAKEGKIFDNRFLE